MARTIDIPERIYGAGSHQVEKIGMLGGEHTVTVAMTMPGWPAISDGDITVRFLVDRGEGPVQEWSDSFAHKILFRGDVPQPSVVMRAKIDAPFKDGHGLVIQVDSDVDVIAAIAVSVE